MLETAIVICFCVFPNPVSSLKQQKNVLFVFDKEPILK